MASPAHRPKVHVFDDEQAVGEFAANMIVAAMEEALAGGRAPVLGLATGSTPLPTYAHLRAKLAGVDLSRVVTFNLDEYIGLPADHPESYRSFMFQHLFTPALLDDGGFDVANIHIPRGTPVDSVDDLPADERALLSAGAGQRLDAEQVAAVLRHRAASYEQLLRQRGPVDVQLLGIGLNGHIGFNEPGSPLDGATFATELTDSTRQANARFFDGNVDLVPRHAITMGVGSILAARRIILIATGAAKADIVAATLSMSTPDAAVPASALLLHPDVHVVLDSAAAAKVKTT